MLFLDFIVAKIEKNLELVTLSGILLRKSPDASRTRAQVIFFYEITNVYFNGKTLIVSL